MRPDALGVGWVGCPRALTHSSWPNSSTWTGWPVGVRPSASITRPLPEYTPVHPVQAGKAGRVNLPAAEPGFGHRPVVGERDSAHPVAARRPRVGGGTDARTRATTRRDEDGDADGEESERAEGQGCAAAEHRCQCRRGSGEGASRPPASWAKAITAAPRSRRSARTCSRSARHRDSGSRARRTTHTRPTVRCSGGSRRVRRSTRCLSPAPWGSLDSCRDARGAPRRPAPRAPAGRAALARDPHIFIIERSFANRGSSCSAIPLGPVAAADHV